MHRYNICHRLATGEVRYLGKYQQWVNEVTQAITLHGAGAQVQRTDDGADTVDVSGVFLVPVGQTAIQTTTPFSVVSKMSQQECVPDVSVARRA